MKDNLDELRHTVGFPIGEDEDLHALSDPPHYTAYPNPHIAEFIEKWGKPYMGSEDGYQREPYTRDVSESKNDQFYTVHSYHTKVPDRIIQKYIEHYTEPGDIVIDVFAGSGMTGVAAQTLGRHAIIIDLCPVATHISRNYIRLACGVPKGVRRLFDQIMVTIEPEFSWMYETDSGAQVNWCVWSEILKCPYCDHENVFYETATSNNTLDCQACGAQLGKKGLERIVRGDHAGYVPVLINYGSRSGRAQRPPNEFDLKMIRSVDDMQLPYWHPDRPISFHEKKWGHLEHGNHRGFDQYSQFYPRRSLAVLSAFRDHVMRVDDFESRSFLLFVLTAASYGLTVFNRFLPERNSNVGMLANTLFVPPLYCETNALVKLKRKFKEIVRAERHAHSAQEIVSTQSATDLSNIPDNTIDYSFVDPPFGNNILYASSNSVMECWLRVFSNGGPEAIISEWRGKTADVYRDLLTKSFSELFRILKPGRWLTVEFHNSRAAIWNCLQEAIVRSGFIIAQVTVMDKRGTTIFMDTRAGAVNKDLVISAYKPRKVFREHFLQQGGVGLEQTFLAQHLRMLPIEVNLERTPEMLYSKYLAYYVQHGYQVAYNAEQFYSVLPQWGFVEVDGYWFADEAQANEYEKRKAKQLGPALKGKAAKQQAVLFISDERSARQWLYHFLAEPKTKSDIYTAFVQALQTSEDEIPELDTLLEEGFVRTNGQWKRPDNLTREELEHKRQARLLRHFEEYLEMARSGKRLKEVRREALVAGFTEAYRESRFEDILAVGRKLDKRLLESSPDLRDFIEIAEAKVES